MTAKVESKGKKGTSSKAPKSERAVRPAEPGEAAGAFAAMRALIDAVPDADLAPINVDIPRAVSTILGALVVCEPHLAKVRELSGGAEAGNLGQLRELTFAAWHAHLAASPQTTESQKEKLLEEATPLRENLLVAAEALAHVNLLDRVSVAGIRAGNGNLDKANDLVALATVFTHAWLRVKDKTTVTWEDIEKAAALGPRLLLALADKPTSLGATEATKARSRAFTLMVRGYSELRRGITYLRWHEADFDTLAPSLYAGRKRRKGGGEGEGDDDGSDGGNEEPQPAPMD